jgi:hypothetical protein
VSSFPTFVNARTSYVLQGWRARWGHLSRWNVDFASATDYNDMDRTRVGGWDGANAVSSEIHSNNQGNAGKHAVLLDIDLPADLLKSSGGADRFHLYIDTALPWRKYKLLLRVLAYCGIIEKGYYKASKRRKATFLRTPDTKKETT